MSKVPTNLQFELALLWRTLNIIKNIDGLSVVDFYEKYIPKVKGMPSLSLSTYWEETSRLLNSDNEPGSALPRSLVGIPSMDGANEEGITDSKRSDNIVSSIPELDYLKHDDRIDQKHDPLQVVQNIYGAAAAFTIDASPYNKSVLLSACLALAVKSGRASLMLHLASILSSFVQADTDGEGQYISVDMDALKDICQHIKAHCEAHYASNTKPQPNPSAAFVSTSSGDREFIAYDRDPLSGGTKVDRDGDRPRGGMLLSFGKADHGKNMCLFCFQ